jgi:DNA-binding response OmpR family regulator
MLSNPRPRVLYVDDDPDSRMMLVLLMKYASIDVRAVGTAAQALALLKQEHFDLYLLDSWLPDLDGLELCRRVRTYAPHTPIVFFSGAAYETDRVRGIAAGADAYIAKPDIDGLLARVKQFAYPEKPTAPVVRRIPRIRQDIPVLAAA